MNQVARIDTASLSNLSRALVGFDTFFDNFEKRFANQVTTNYPPYNVIQISDNEYSVQLAVAGFDLDDLSVTKDKNFLIVAGTAPVSDSKVEPNFIHRGLSQRNFRREFQLADHVEIKEANLELGILNIYLVREIPIEQRPKTIAIKQTK